jgi:predicted GH43/DUF377 family glycosyl hydrolase
MVGRLKKALMIRPGDVPPSDIQLEVVGTFNPGATEHNNEIVLLVRIAERPRERLKGFIGLPRWQDGKVVVDWVANQEIEFLDSRVVRRKEDGLLRLTSTSHLRVFRSKDGRSIDGSEGARVCPAEEYESYGLEDPRITFIDDRYWITYVTVSQHGAATALASTVDFETFQRHGIIFCPENKDVVLFPDRVNGQFWAMHRPTTAHTFCRPEMWCACSHNLFDWGSHRPLHGGFAAWENERVGAGTPPVRTNDGWLEIYHASRRAEVSDQVGEYTACAMLLERDEPSQIVALATEPLWKPDAAYETSGFVPRVVFPTGIVVHQDIVQLYYGAADTCTAMAEFRLSDIGFEPLHT